MYIYICMYVCIYSHNGKYSVQVSGINIVVHAYIKVNFGVNDVVKIMFPEWSRQGVLVECYNVHRTLWHLLT